MYRYLFDRDGRTERADRYSRGRWRRRWPRSRAGRWLLWLLILVVLLVILSQLFGGFQRGTKVGSLASAAATAPAPAPASAATPWLSQPRGQDNMVVTWVRLFWCEAFMRLVRGCR
jgi:hypothetical protein